MFTVYHTTSRRLNHSSFHLKWNIALYNTYEHQPPLSIAINAPIYYTLSLITPNLFTFLYRTNESEGLFEWIAATYAQETIRNFEIFIILRLRNTTSKCTSFTRGLC
eukprot:748709_1